MRTAGARCMVSLILVLFLAGCAGSTTRNSATSGAPTSSAALECPDDALRRAAYAAAESFIEGEMLKTAFTLKIEGTMKGEVGTWTLALDPTAKALRVSTPSEDIRVAGAEYSVATKESNLYGRNHDSGAKYAEVFSFLEKSVTEPEASFSDDLTVEDYVATCTTQGGVQVVRYTYDKEGRKDVNVAERAAPHRPLSGEVVDPALQNNYRASMAYAKPAISIDSSLPKAPLNILLDVITFGENARGGISMIAEIDEGSEWAPFSQFHSQLVVTSSQEIYTSRLLQEGVWDMGDGDLFEYQDKDRNRMISTGDRFSMDVGPDLDVAFFDDWANSAVNLQAASP